MNRWAHHGAVLAGGFSSRMGIPKEDLVLPNGVTMIDQMIATLSQACSGVVVVGGRPRLQQTLPDLRPGTGPLGGIETLLASGIDDEYLICPSDIPLVTAPLMERLLVEADEPVTVFVVPSSGWVHPLPMRVSAAALPQVSDCLDGGERAIHRFLQGIATRQIELSDTDARLLTNVNTASDFDSLS